MRHAGPPGVSMTPRVFASIPGRGMVNHATRRGYGESYYTREGYSRSICISGEMYKMIASLPYPVFELVLREKRYDCRTLRLRSATRCFLSLRRERLLDAVAEKSTLTATAVAALKLDCYCRIAQTWKRLQLLADYYDQLFIPEI